MSVTPRVWVAEHVLRAIAREAQQHAPLESGGILLGYRSADREEVVTHALGPGPDAHHRREVFVPDYAHDRRVAVDGWEQSGGSEYYVGDWHSHPESEPYLSDRDRKVMQSIALDRESQLVHPLMIVVGLHPDIAVVAWRLAESDAGVPEPEPCEVKLFKSPEG